MPSLNMICHGDESLIDDVENDEELLAELLALGGDADVVTKKRTNGRSAPYAGHQFSQPNETQSEEENMSTEEMDVDDEELLNELSHLAGPSVEVNPATKRDFQKASTDQSELDKTSPMRNTAPKRPKTLENNSNLSKNEQKQADAATSASNGPPPIPPDRTLSVSLPQKVDIAQQQNQSPDDSATVENKSISQIESLESRAKKLLIRRRKLYMDRSLAAKRVNDRAAAVEAFQTVKMFNQALEATSQGAQLSEDDLSQIPPSPPPYDTNGGSVQLGKISGSSSVVVSDETTREKTNASNSSMSDDLKLVLTRQLQLKQEAVAAKRRGDLAAAKEFLSLSHRMDQMVDAAKCGIPIDVQHLPALHSNSEVLSKSATKTQEIIDEETLRKCKLLEKELLKQIGFCEEKLDKFQSAGDSKNVLLYEGLLQKSKIDLQRVQLAALGQAQLPGFNLPVLSLPVIELNSSISDDKLELKIKKIENLKIPEGWKPSDCALYVIYKFPFPHVSHQTGRTSIIKGTNSPAFADAFQLDINRKTKQFLRICKRQPIKLEIYQKGGFFRSDKLFANADISMQELEKSATICASFPLLEGRKKTSGTVQIELRIRTPLDVVETATNAKRKWVKLDC